MEQAIEFAEKLREIASVSPERVALLVHENNKPSISVNADHNLRLRSVKKLAIGLGYAQKAVSDPAIAATSVPLETLGTPRYYDGGAHEEWKKSLAVQMDGKGTIPQTASLEEVAQGMMQYSSNNCTEHLINALGTDNLNALCEKHNIHTENFTPIYDELHAPAHGTAADMVKLCETIAASPEPVRERMQSIAQHTFIGGAKGFGKGGSGIIIDNGTQIHDLNYAWHAKQKGRDITACFLTNDLPAETAGFLEERLVPFLNECSTNRTFLEHCADLFKGPIGKTVATVARNLR